MKSIGLWNEVNGAVECNHWDGGTYSMGRRNKKQHTTYNNNNATTTIINNNNRAYADQRIVVVLKTACGIVLSRLVLFYLVLLCLGMFRVTGGHGATEF